MHLIIIYSFLMTNELSFYFLSFSRFHTQRNQYKLEKERILYASLANISML